ncbi:MAG: hypothetical protein SF162_17505 [bacterium]|nr:hypothetical protein [bacterium]
MYPSLSLNADWMCDYFEPEPPHLYEFAEPLVVPSLRGWSPDKRFDDHWAAWLQKSFALAIADVCVNYTLHIDRAPAGTRIYLNNALLATFTGQPLVLDVTDTITWEANTLAFRVPCGGDGSFSGVFLRPAPCN